MSQRAHTLVLVGLGLLVLAALLYDASKYHGVDAFGDPIYAETYTQR